MKTRFAPRIAALLICLGCALPKANPQPAANSQSPHCAQILFCLFNQKASASDPTGIHKYSRDVIDLVLPNQWTAERSPSGRMETFEKEFLGEDYAAKLANRLARAEQTARAGNGKLVSEADVARAFNELMKEVGAPSSLRTDEAAIHRFREHAAAIHAFPALFTADRNGADCNPGEAVFLLYLLVSGNGVLYDRNLDFEAALMQRDGQQSEWGPSFGVARMERLGSDASDLLSTYLSHRGRRATITLFNNLAATLGF